MFYKSIYSGKIAYIINKDNYYVLNDNSFKWDMYIKVKMQSKDFKLTTYYVL